MTEHEHDGHEHDERDEVFDVMRRARPGDLPDELVSPTTPAAQALLEEILSMDTMHAPDGVTGEPPAGAGHDGTPVLDTLTTARRRRTQPSRRRLLVVGAAAAAVVAVATTAILTVDSSYERVDAATVEAAVAATAAAMENTGRAEIQWRMEDADGSERGRGVDEIAYSGQDVQWLWQVRDMPQRELRIVDGEWYTDGETESDADWYHEPDAPERTFPDPRTLLEHLAVGGHFDEVGEEDVDGVPTTRLRANSPEATPDDIVTFFLPGAASGVLPGYTQELTVTDIELWVDEDNLVRRFDITVADTLTDEDTGTVESDVRWTHSMRFYDFGAPITVEAPEGAVEIPTIEAPEGAVEIPTIEVPEGAAVDAP